MKKEIAKILQQRDGISENAAWNLIEECQREINYLIDDHGTLEEIEIAIQDYLGLEPDYLFDFIG